jgi:hypothetical protein
MVQCFRCELVPFRSHVLRAVLRLVSATAKFANRFRLQSVFILYVELLRLLAHCFFVLFPITLVSFPIVEPLLFQALGA